MSWENIAIDNIPLILVKSFPPLADSLLEKCGQLVTDDMLHEISEADYGIYADAHLAALLPIRDEVRVPAPMPWEPKEVLELIRWSQPEDPEWQPGCTGERGHIMRAFCCAALLRAAAEPANDGYFGGENQTLIQLIDSALYLNRGLPEAAGSYLTWRIPQLRDDDEERPFLVFGLIALSLLLNQHSLTASNIDMLVSFVEQAEADASQMGARKPETSAGWSFLAGTCFDARHSAWLALAAKIRFRHADSERVVRLARKIEAT